MRVNQKHIKYLNFQLQQKQILIYFNIYNVHYLYLIINNILRISLINYDNHIEMNYLVYYIKMEKFIQLFQIL